MRRWRARTWSDSVVVGGFRFRFGLAGWGSAWVGWVDNRFIWAKASFDRVSVLGLAIGDLAKKRVVPCDDGAEMVGHCARQSEGLATLSIGRRLLLVNTPVF